jgi:hypothetical protein
MPDYIPLSRMLDGIEIIIQNAHNSTECVEILFIGEERQMAK